MKRTSLGRPALLFCFAFSSLLSAMIPSTFSIPRTKAGAFVADGLFQGGASKPTSLDNLRVSEHREEGYERWVFDFGPANGMKGKARNAPVFQIQYQKGESFRTEEGTIVQAKAPSFIFRFQNITQNKLTLEKLKRLAEESDFVKQITLYPAIEDGDLAIEFSLNHEVLYEPHQPIEKASRLVVDLKMKHS